MIHGILLVVGVNLHVKMDDEEVVVLVHRPKRGTKIFCPPPLGSKPMAPIKIKVELSIEERPSLCILPRGKKRNVTYHVENEQLIGADDNCDYRGITTTSSKSSVQYCLATLNTTEASKDGYQTLTLRPVAKVYDSWETSVRGYQQHFRGFEGSHEQYKAMIEDFASAKKRKLVRAREANQLVEEKDQANAKDDEDINKPSAVEDAAREFRKSFLPRWDESTKEPSKVYDFKAFTGLAVWNRIESMANSGFNTKGCLPSIESLFAESLNQAKNPTQTQLCCGVLCAVLSNLFVRSSRKKNIPGIESGRTNYFGQPIFIAERFLSKFTTDIGSNRSMSKANRDSCLVHIFLLYLMANHKLAKVDSLRGLTTDLEIDGSEASLLLRQAGCKVLRKTNTYAAAIRTPLKFPAISRGKR